MCSYQLYLRINAMPAKAAKKTANDKPLFVKVAIYVDIAYTYNFFFGA